MVLAHLIATGVIPTETAEQAAERFRRVITVNATDWTGVERRLNSDPVAVSKVKAAIGEAHSQLAKTGLTNFERAKAHSILIAIESLVDSPEPEWRAIANLFAAPALSNIMGFANILLLVFQVLNIL